MTLTKRQEAAVSEAYWKLAQSRYSTSRELADRLGGASDDWLQGKLYALDIALKLVLELGTVLKEDECE